MHKKKLIKHIVLNFDLKVGNIFHNLFHGYNINNIKQQHFSYFENHKISNNLRNNILLHLVPVNAFFYNKS